MHNNDPYGIKVSKDKEREKLEKERINGEALTELVKEIKNIGEKIGKIEEKIK